MTLSPFIAEAQQKMFRMIHLLLDQIEQQQAPFDAPDDPIRTALLREASGIMALWAACDRPACRRARECRRPPSHCIKHYMPLLPPEARAGAVARLKARHAPSERNTLC